MHSHLILKTVFLIIYFFAFPAAFSAQNSSPQPPSAETLAAINKAITDVQNEIARRNSERASAYQLLETTEKEMLSLNNEISLIEADIKQNASEVEKLQAQRNQLLLQKNSQQELIGKYLRSAYQSGQEEYFKLLLNQEDPVLIARTLRYYQYFNDARSQKIDEYGATIEELSKVEKNIQDSTLILNDKRALLTLQQASMQARITDRQKLLDELDGILTSSSRKLEALESEKVETELLVEELRRSIANLRLGDQEQPFASMKGKLPRPVDGTFKNRWGSSYGLGDLSWEGVTIEAGAGEEIQAIHRGRVVFSDWFSSSGLLLIIDHGDGYMSLYAHNQELYKDVGEWVVGGDIIAAVGNTGGEASYGLYFEIRHNGDSVNPSSWFQARN